MSAYRSVSRTSLKPGAYMQRERPDHTLQPTALVNEADLRLIKAPQVAWDDRAHFFGIAARVCGRSWSTTRGSAAHTNADGPARAAHCDCVPSLPSSVSSSL